ncbi:S-DNA-T family DNA segregation ATPase FtsK/SpoIIIE [Haloactinospora alba]|uniref:S-DNA-T family DNA segregation ATPase FtsK/SpoIIIE n=1 Tax=Haloactinospora alba TaxID=405555 RepID=A0A543NLC6_9ACTN|nr:FtsK/SpoIIIE domain-containing protein [Haloactinospora alba]TQN32631.1 S-DNA-T family DNA segregation ATPase FtsK/SpoIIIE [Haloactinospora alba]
MLRDRSAGSAQVQPTTPLPAHGVRFTTPVVETPGIVIVSRWVYRLLRLVVLTPVRFPIATALLSTGAMVVSVWGWIPLAAGILLAGVGLGVWWWYWPAVFHRLVVLRSLACWRWLWVYRRHWQPVLVVAGLAESYQERHYLPRIKTVSCTAWADRVRITLVQGTTPRDLEDRVTELAHGFQAPSCRVYTRGPRDVVLEFPRRDLLANPLPARPVPDQVDMAALEVGLCEDGTPWDLRLHGTHVLTVGVTGSGKGSVLWSAIRAMTPAMVAGTAQVWAIDPKRMELSYGRSLFARYADTAEAAVDVLEAAVSEMHARADRYAGIRRTHTPTVEDPFMLVVLDEVAFLTAYHPEKDIRRRAENAIATLTSQGRAVGVCVLAALQDPRKEVMNLRNLFPDKVALRLDEASQVDMVLGDDARERGANAHLIDPNVPGVAFVRMEGSPLPVRVRAAFVSDDDIEAMANEYGTRSLHPVPDVEVA